MQRAGMGMNVPSWEGCEGCELGLTVRGVGGMRVHVGGVQCDPSSSLPIPNVVVTTPGFPSTVCVYWLRWYAPEKIPFLVVQVRLHKIPHRARGPFVDRILFVQVKPCIHQLLDSY